MRPHETESDAAGLLTVGAMSLINVQLDSDFKWLLLFPSLLWGIGLLSLLAAIRRRTD